MQTKIVSRLLITYIKIKICGVLYELQPHLDFGDLNIKVIQSFNIFISAHNKDIMEIKLLLRLFYFLNLIYKIHSS